MLKSNDGIILEDCLISFMLLSTYLMLMLLYMSDLYGLKADIKNANGQINELKVCMLSDCQLSSGNNITTKCTSYYISQHQEEVCIEI